MTGLPTMSNQMECPEVRRTPIPMTVTPSPMKGVNQRGIFRTQCIALQGCRMPRLWASAPKVPAAGPSSPAWYQVP
jgi:hypothetical protein